MTEDLASLASLGADVAWPDSDAGRGAAAGLGATLDGLAAWLEGAQGAHPPHDLHRVRAFVFGAAEPAAAQTAVADLVRADLLAVPPMAGSVAASVAAGAALVDVEVDSGADLLVVGAARGGAAAAVVASVLTDTEPVKVLPRGTALDTETWIGLAIDVRDRRLAAIGARDAPEDLLALVGDPDLAAVTGCLLRAAGRRTPVLIDGPVAAAAALLAHAVQPRTTLWLRAADRGSDPVQRLALDRLDLPAVLDFGSGGGDLTVALIAVTALRAAALRGAAPVTTPGPGASADV